jgi:hypothetical protein
MIERFNITKYYLVGEVVGGTFGKHHHDEFFDIISQKEKLAFLDQVVVNEQERKAKKRAAREGMWETVGTVVAVVGLSILTMGVGGAAIIAAVGGVGSAGAAIAVGAAYTAVGGYIAYQGHKGYQMGGEKGLVLGVATAALGMYTAGKGMAFTAGGSYSHEQGFGVSMGYNFMGGSDGKTSLGNIGISYSEKGGFGLSGGYNINPNIGINANIHQSGAWGVGASVHQTNDARIKDGLGLNVGYRETADGKVGLTGGVNYNHTMGNSTSGFGTMSMGYNYDTLFGGGVSLGYSQTDTGQSLVSGFSGQVSWNVNAGFQSQLDISYSWERTANFLAGHGAISDLQIALNQFEAEYGDLNDLDKAFQKAAMGLPLSEMEIALIEKAQRDAAQRKEAENVMQGAGAVTARNDERKKKGETIQIALDAEEKAEFLKKAEKYLVSKVKDFLENEGKDLLKVKQAFAEYENNPNAETAAKLVEAYEETKSAMGAGFIPIAGDVLDGIIAVKDFYRGDYLNAGLSTATIFAPFLPAPVAKKFIKGILETPLGKKMADSYLGKLVTSKLGKKTDSFGVDETMQSADEIAGVLKNGSYIRNPTAQSLDKLITASGKINSKNMSGNYMYVIDSKGNIIIGTRAGQKMPHPTLIGGKNPQVQGAGIVDIRGGQIYSIDNYSGHFKPNASSLEAMQNAFGKYPKSTFHKRFQGYKIYGE